MIQLRDYQQDMIDKVVQALRNGYRKILVVLPTGSGKTVLASELVRRSYLKGKSSTFICHRQELIEQTYRAYTNIGITPAIIKGGMHPDYKNPMQIASVNTLVRRLDKYKVPDLLFVDECFVSGTKVITSNGYTEIQDIKKGDLVKTFNEATKRIEYKKVLKLIKKERKENLVCVLVNGRKIVCTENHLFFTKKGWKKAKDLSSMDMVLSTTDRKGKDNDRKMCNMWFGCRTHKIKERASEKNRDASLSDLYQGKKKKNIIRNYGENESDLLTRKNEDKQPNETFRCKGESIDNSSCNGLETKDSRRKRNWSDCLSDASCFCSRVGNGSCCEHESLEGWKRVSYELQDRYCEQRFKDSYRDRRKEPLFSSCSGQRQTEGQVSDWARVESCEIYERGDRKELGELCEESFVYDLTVEDNHNYFVEGILVHNCHHSKAKQWSDIINWAGKSIVIGLTATPCRLDGKPLNDMYETMIQTVSTKDLINMGYLVPYLYYAPSVINTDELKSSGGDYTKASLESASFNQKIIGDNIEQYKKLANGKRNVVFAISRKHALNICERYKLSGINAAVLDGELSSSVRKKIIESFRNNDIKVIVSIDVISEGFDLPAIECVSLLRPTQSTSLYLQQVGRALRTCEEMGKRQAIILDHVNNYKTHGMPDDDRQWSLTQEYKAKRNREESTVHIKRCPMCYFAHSPSLVCPNCGYQYGADGKTIEEVAGELALIGSSEYNNLKKKEVIIAKNLFDLVRIERQREYKYGWAEWQYKLKTGIDLKSSFEGFEEIAAARGYNRSWAWVQWNRVRGR